MRMLRIVLCLMMSAGLGVAGFYALSQSGDLKREASIVDACRNAPSGDARPQSCPDRPISETEVKVLKDDAGTYDVLSVVAFLILVFGVGSVLYDFITDLDDDD